ncbi:MAG: hypothetical protein ACFFB3_18485 [Candidatus Hodarchaeota archaeon]
MRWWNRGSLRIIALISLLSIGLTVSSVSSISEQPLARQESSKNTSQELSNIELQNPKDFRINQGLTPLSSLEPNENQQIQHLCVLYPNGGEILSGDVSILWTPTSSIIREPEYSVYYSPNAGIHWLPLAFYIDSNIFRWETPLYEKEGTSFLVKVIAFGRDGKTEVDFSDDVFRINNRAENNNGEDIDNQLVQVPCLTVLYPNGGETLIGEVMISWAVSDSFEEPTFSVYYSPDAGYTWIQLASRITETQFAWDTDLHENKGTSYLIRVIAFEQGIAGRLEVDFSDYSFDINNEIVESDKPLDQLWGLLVSFIVISGVTGIALGYVLFNPRFRKQSSFFEYMEFNEVEFLTAIRHKVIIGLDHVKHQLIADSRDITSLEEPNFPRDTTTPASIADCFPLHIRSDLREIKGRTVLTLIEIAYQNPIETNPTKLAKALNIPPSTLSNEIKKLIDLQYIEEHISPQILSDGRFKNFRITSKGFKLLILLNEALRVTIDQLKENNSVEKIIESENPYLSSKKAL